MTEPMPRQDEERRRIVDAARNVWTRRLIDHSRANSLLFYRDLKVGTLDLTSEPEIVSRLLAGEVMSAASLGSEPDGATTGQGDFWARPREKGRSVRAALLALQRKALANREEKGIETLHLAIGMATWPAPDGGRPYEAPIVLIPAKIEARGQGGEDLRLSVAGEPQVNPVLLYVVEENHDIRVNTAEFLAECCNEDDAGDWHINSESVVAQFERLASRIEGLDVANRAILANFQFAKMAMVEDLKKNGDAILSSSVVAAVAGHSPTRKALAQAVTHIDLFELDERPASADFLVLDADSTQHRAIVLAGKGQNGVVHGPPGTGKSQTIANLIAQSVADGRRVLFVAEKRAALDAVIKRLNHPDVDLGHLILDLHGASVSRKEVMARLGVALEEIRTSAPAAGAEATHREFEARRKQLNEHARRINQVRQPTGFSVNRMIGLLLRLPSDARSTLRLRGKVLEGLNVERAEVARELVLEGAAHPTLLLGTDPSPWNNARINDGKEAASAIDLAKTAAIDCWPEALRQVDSLVTNLGAKSPGSLNDIASLLRLLRDTRRVVAAYEEAVLTLPMEDIVASLEPAGRGFWARCRAFLADPDYRLARGQILAQRRLDAPSERLLRDASFILDVSKRWRGLGLAPDNAAAQTDASSLRLAFSRLRRKIKALTKIVHADLRQSSALPTVVEQLRTLAADERTPYLLPEVYRIRKTLNDFRLTSLMDDLRANPIRAEHWVSRFEYVWIYSALEDVLASDPALAAFNGRTHEQIIAEFVRLDRERVRMAAKRVRRLHAERAIEAMNQNFDQTNLIRTEARKKSRHIPLRDLLRRAPDVLTRIAPCWVASPLSVSQLLDTNRHFDIVLFDEASQILQEESIPALYRAEQVVVAGDRHQLPPTTFFATAVEGEDEAPTDDDTRSALNTAVASIGGFESLLDTLEAFLPNWLLEWHYRSEDERLITFSNARVYSGRLVTFPSARGLQAIRHVLVQGPGVGGQEESATAEVDEVVRQVLIHAEQRPDESLGVITMGIKHANRIQAALDRETHLRADLADFFSLDREERFFIKNLETVQGDERDAIDVPPS